MVEGLVGVMAVALVQIGRDRSVGTTWAVDRDAIGQETNNGGVRRGFVSHEGIPAMRAQRSRHQRPGGDD